MQQEPGDRQLGELFRHAVAPSGGDAAARVVSVPVVPPELPGNADIRQLLTLLHADFETVVDKPGKRPSLPGATPEGVSRFSAWPPPADCATLHAPIRFSRWAAAARAGIAATLERQSVAAELESPTS